MEIKDFNGFLDFRDETFPFTFKNGILTIIPPTIEKWSEFYKELFHWNFNKKQKNKWLDKKIINGITDKYKGVKFFVTDNPSYSNGYYSYSVDYLYIYDCKNNSDEMYDINGIRFKGPECNYFYNVSEYINEDFETKDNKFSRFNLEVLSKDDKDFGKFRWHNYTVSIKGSLSWKKANDTYSPLEIDSLIVLNLSRCCNDLEKLLELVSIQRIVLAFCAYRKNITFKEIDTYTYVKDKLKRKTGNIYIFNEKEIEKDIKHLRQIIDLRDINFKISKLYKLALDNKLYTTHICQNYLMRNSYTPARVLSILIAFEHTFKIIYKDVSLSNDEFNLAKIKTIKFLDEQISINSGKLKKKFKGLKNSVNKTKLGYDEHLKYALNDNFKVLEPFIKNRFQVKNTKTIVSKSSERINNIRNLMAHGNLDIKFKPINSNDIYLVELLLYSMILKYIGLEAKIIQDKIKKLFNIYL